MLHTVNFDNNEGNDSREGGRRGRKERRAANGIAIDLATVTDTAATCHSANVQQLNLLLQLQCCQVARLQLQMAKRAKGGRRH